MGGVPTLIGGGANLRHRCFLVKTYVKMKEFGPVGGGARRKLLYVDPPLQVLYPVSDRDNKTNAYQSELDQIIADATDHTLNTH